MNRRVDIDLEVQWPPAKASEQQPADQYVVQESRVSAQPDQTDNSVLGDLKTYGSRELFEGAKEVGIKHAGSVYRLKITRQGKLILNK